MSVEFQASMINVYSQVKWLEVCSKLKVHPKSPSCKKKVYHLQPKLTV